MKAAAKFVAGLTKRARRSGSELNPYPKVTHRRRAPAADRERIVGISLQM